MAFVRGKTSAFSALDALPHPTQGSAPLAVITMPSTDAMGHGHALSTVKGLARMTTMPDAMLHSARRQGRPTVLPRTGGEETTHRRPTRVTLPSVVYKRRRQTPDQDGRTHTRTLIHFSHQHLHDQGLGNLTPSLTQGCIPYYKHQV